MAPRIDYAELLGMRDDGFAKLRFLGEAAYRWLGLGDHERADAIFTALRTLAPEDPVGHLGEAELRLAMRAYRDAERAALRATCVRNTTPSTMAMAYCLRSRALCALGRGEQAVRLLRDAATLDPRGPGGREAKMLAAELRVKNAVTPLSRRQVRVRG